MIDNSSMKLSKTARLILGWTLGVVLVFSSPIFLGFGVSYLRHRPPTPRPLPSAPAQFPFTELAALDRVVQERFAVVPDKDFGAARIGPRHEYFRPLTKQEKQAIEGLQKARKNVVFYVVGRNFLPGIRGVTQPTTVQGPIYFTPGSKFSVSATKTDKYSMHSTRFQTRPVLRHDLPPEEELVHTALSVFAQADVQNGVNTRIGCWKVTSVPVRATDLACVNCHNTVPVSWQREGHSTLLNPRNADKVAPNQALGIAMYCYQDAK
ncbi:hypothetical protein IAD21_03348 [Abditibacteriota bacterium]|nr:hypothetical protein IAD21_03348 [Abditibacteriota bacterium]